MLYTAVTRARINVWIYDEDKIARSPMFEYLQALKLVKKADLEGRYFVSLCLWHCLNHLVT